jgi:D-glycero-D-manno-heptose 1,7-bisphosphate phosphatase
MMPGLFLDRDGVIIRDTDYVRSLEQVEFIPGVAQAIRRINDHGWPIIVVTNQSGVARGYFPETLVHDVHDLIQDWLAREAGARIDLFLHCPHHRTEGLEAYRKDCDCRKPKPGMLRTGAERFPIDLEQSWLVGDRRSDLEAAAAVRARSILVYTGASAPGDIDMTAPDLTVATSVPSLVEAVEWILTHEAGRNHDA